MVDGREGGGAIVGADRRGASKAVAEIPLLVALAVVIAFTFKVLVAQAFFIPSESMVPQLEVGDRIVVSKIAYRLHDPRRGDIAVFDCPPRADCPASGGRRFLPVRLVVGLFEAVGLRQPSTEEYIKRVVGLPGEQVQGLGGKVYVNARALIEPYLPPGTTTSNFGPVRVGPGELWVMGDNRARSADSRVFGTIERSTVVGRAVVRAWPVPKAAFL